MSEAPAPHSSVSEYDIAPNSAPLFLVGEMWAALHARGISLRSLQPGQIVVAPAGVARILPHATLVSRAEYGPKSSATDLSEALSRYSAADSSALLTGYSRLGYEVLDGREPAFTDSVLDLLQVPEPRPRALASPPSDPLGLGRE